MNHTCRYSALAGFGLVIATPAFAQLEEIVVTARRREESLQNVPISVAVYEGDVLLRGGFTDMEDFSTFIPNLFMDDGLVGQRLSIRGIGTASENEAFEQAVAQFHDGVYYGRDNLGQNSVFDLERIEVVRGPQPTFAGQSATAGAINLVSRRPGDVFESNMTMGYGDGEETSLEFGLGGPITSTFGLRIAGRYYDLDETGYTQVTTGEPVGTKENTAIRLTGVWSPSQVFELAFKYEHQDVFQLGVPREWTRCETRPQFSRAHPLIARNLPAMCALDAAYNGMNLDVTDRVIGVGGSQDVYDAINALNAASGAMPGDPDYWTGAGMSPVAANLDEVWEFNQPQEREHAADVVAVDFDWQIGRYTLSSVTSALEYDKEDWLDPDSSSFALIADHRTEFFEQTGQELRLSSPVDQTVSWMVGLYWQSHDLDNSINTFLPFIPMGPPTVRAVSFGGRLLEESDWRSVFFAASWNVSDTFRINFGGRYQDVEKTGVLSPSRALLGTTATEYGPRSPIGMPVSGRVDTDDTLPEVGFEWDVRDDVMLYAKYSEAFKAGGFVMSPAIGGMLPNPFTYDPEFAEGIEVGLKGIYLDGQLALNFALYDTDYRDLQVVVIEPTTANFVTTNAAKAHTTGLEIDGRWAVSDTFSLGFDAAFGGAEYDDYDGAECNSLEAKLAGMGPCTTDLSGESLPFAPDWTLSLRPQYSFNLGSNLSASLAAYLVFSDDYVLFSDRDPINHVDSWSRLDLRLAIGPTAGNWEIAVYGRNVTDEDIKIGGPVGFQSKSLDQVYDGGGATLQRGSRYGVQLQVSF